VPPVSSAESLLTLTTVAAASSSGSTGSAHYGASHSQVSDCRVLHLVQVCPPKAITCHLKQSLGCR
jgi:hypothetical protein